MINNQYILSFGTKHKILDSFERKEINISGETKLFYDDTVCINQIINKVFKSTFNIFPIYFGIKGGLIYNNKIKKFEPYIRDFLPNSIVSKNKKCIIIKKINDDVDAYIPCKYYGDKYTWIEELVNKYQKNDSLCHLKENNTDVVFCKDEIYIIGDIRINIEYYKSYYDTYLNYFTNNPNVNELILHTNLGLIRVERDGFYELYDKKLKLKP
jgi:hypothetical protein